MQLLHFSLLFCFLDFFSCNQVMDYPQLSMAKDHKVLIPNNSTASCQKSAAQNIIFHSKDGGDTWEDISGTLPETEKFDGFFTSDTDLFSRINNAFYHAKNTAGSVRWEKEYILNQSITNISFNTSGVVAFNYEGQIYQQLKTTGTWVPIYANLQQLQLRTVFETSSGIIFVGSDSGLFKSVDKGQNWTQVQNEGWVMEIVENKNVLLATGQKGIMRSTDNGENWEWVISEGGVGIDIEKIDGGYAAITYNTETKSRRVRISMDEGKNWKAIDNGLQASESISSIKSFGKYLFCGHPDGIYRSSDLGKTWNLVKPSIDKKVFSLYISGNVLYAIPRNYGC